MWRLLLFELVIAAIVAVVWLLGPMVGVKSVAARLIIIFALVIPPIIYVIWRFFSARKDARRLESAIKEQGVQQQKIARPEKQQEVRVLNEAFGKAVGALRRSKLGGGKGTALYALPWYMIIGPPAVGKSTALLRSGLKFPFSADGKSAAIKGVGGTRNCDWWFSDQAILLDTAGRYTSEEEDREEWLSFLRLLKKYRKRKALNGLLVAVSIADLLTATPEEVEEMAAQIRSRVDQVIAELDLVIPVYVLFTKCDLISGFVEYFSDLSRSSRSQVMGFTVPLTTPETNVEGLFQKEFDLLMAALRDRCLTRLSRAKSQIRGDVFQFPLQLAAARDALSAFMAQLFVPNPYRETPRLRGAYFCSGTQEGRPLDRVMSMMSRALGLREAQSSFMERKAKKSYFLHGLFTNVLFPDQHLAGSTASRITRRMRLQFAVFAALLAAAIGVLGVGVISFRNNRALIDSTMQLSKDTRLGGFEEPGEVLGALFALDKLSARVDTLIKHREEGPPWLYSFGLYSGDELVDPARGLFVKRMKRVFVDPVASELEATLIDIANAPVTNKRTVSKDYDILKSYLMVTNRRRLDVEAAVPLVIPQWKRRLHPDSFKHGETLVRLSTRYLELIKNGEARWTEADRDIIRSAQTALRARDVEYQRLIADTDRVLGKFTLRDALRGRVQTILKATHSVPGVYTYRGYTKFIRTRLAKLKLRGSKIEPWVLGEDEGTDLAARLRQRYYDQYIFAWKRFLRGISLRRPRDLRDSLRVLEALTESPMLYDSLFNAIKHNTDFSFRTDMDSGEALREAGYLARGRTGMAIRRAERMKRLAGKAGKRKKRIDPSKLNRVEREFLELRYLVDPPPTVDDREQVSGLKQYLSQLAIVRDEVTAFVSNRGTPEIAQLDKAIEEARRVTKGVLAGLKPEYRALLGPLFYTPLGEATGQADKTYVARSSQVFSNQLCDPYRANLGGRYPFAKSSREALLQDVVDYLSPAGTVWTYFNTNYKNQLVRQGNQFKSEDGKVPGHIIRFFNRAWAMTRAFFPHGSQSPGIRFEVRPHPVVLAEKSGVDVSEIILEVDGKSRTYRNGPIEQWAFSWPGTTKRTRLILKGAGGLRERLSFGGDWGLLRLIDQAKVKKSGSWYQVWWTLRDGQIKVRMDFRPSRTENPFFRRLRLGC
jgi:type VI secretion system protein ImpL